MKVKTSVSLEVKWLAVLKKEAKREDRSVSYLLEKFLEEKAKELHKIRSKKKSKPEAVSRHTGSSEANGVATK